MLEKLRKRKDEKHKPEKLSNRETTKLMVKRAKLTVIMCNLRSKTRILQRFIRKSFAVSKKYAYLCSDSSHHASHLHSEPGWDFCFSRDKPYSLATSFNLLYSSSSAVLLPCQ